MLNFFRRIRIRFLSEGQIRKYFFYALGEILLVVIGILIALQLNNLNEAKKDRVYELKMLKELKLSLQNDIDNLEWSLARLSKRDSAVKDFISLANQGYDRNDSILQNPLYERRWWNLRTGVDYRINFGPYEAIKSSGIDRIANDSLRNALINFYDFELPRFIEFNLWYDRKFTQNLERQNAFRKDPVIREIEGELLIEKDIPWDLYMSTEWLDLLKEIGESTGWLSGRLEQFIPEMQYVVNALDSEIKSN